MGVNHDFESVAQSVSDLISLAARRGRWFPLNCTAGEHRDRSGSMCVSMSQDNTDMIIPEARPDSKEAKREELRSVIRMTVPIVITLCSRMVMDLADFRMISYLGSDAQAAIMPAQITMWTFIVLCFVTVTIVNTFVSQSLGRGRLEATGAYTMQGVYLGLLYGLGGLALYPVLPSVFSRISNNPEVVRQGLIYGRIALLTVGPTIAAEAFASFFNGIHRPKVSMWSAIECNLLNVIVSLVLIFGLLGFPKMGIAGAAWGTFVGVVYRLFRLWFVFRSSEYEKEYLTRSSWRLDFHKTKDIIRIGLPQGVQAFSDVFVWAVFVGVLIGARFPDADLVATNVAWQFLRLSFMPAFGLGIALSSLVGKSVGAGDKDRAVRVTRISTAILVSYLLTLSIVYLVFRRELIGWWNPDPAVIEIGASIMICAAVFQVFDGLGILYNSALRGAGDTFWPALMVGVSHWVFVIGGGWLAVTLAPQWGAVGPWIAATCLLVFLGFIMWYRWNSGAWRKLDILKPKAGEHDAPPSGGFEPSEAEQPVPVETPM